MDLLILMEILMDLLMEIVYCIVDYIFTALLPSYIINL